MQLTLASIAHRPGSGPMQQLLLVYLKRLAAYTRVEAPVYRSEAALFKALARQRARTEPWLVLLDSRGKQLSSERFAASLEHERSSGRQEAVLAIGPADGWSEQARGRAGLLLSLGAMTLPHELARLIVAEQLYRAWTILAGHPYHSSHTG